MTSGSRRIGFVVGLNWDHPGGVQRVTRSRAQTAAQEGDRVHILAMAAPGEEESENWEAGVLVRRIAPGSSDTSDGSADGFDSLNASPHLEREVLAWCTSHSLEFVHVQHLAAFGLGLPARLRERGIAFDWTLHDYHAWCPRGQMWSADGDLCQTLEPEKCANCWERTWPHLGTLESARVAVNRRTQLAVDGLAACDRVCVPSEGARAVAESCGVAASSMEVVPNPRDVSNWTLPEREFDPAHIRVGVLGSVQPSKGVLELARWIVELGAPFHLEVHGPLENYHGDTSYIDAFLNLVEDEPALSWSGPYEGAALPLLLNGLDLVCVPSLWNEVFGLVAYEAAAAGLPVFVSDRGGLPEAPGHQLPAGDGARWKSALERFAVDQVWREGLGA